MSFLEEKFLKYISEDILDTAGIKRLIELDPSLLMLHVGEGTALMKLVDLDFDFSDLGNLTMVAFDTLRYPQAYGDNLEIFRGMLKPTEEFFNDVIDMDLGNDLTILVSNTNSNIIYDVFPEVVKKKYDKILELKVFSLHQLNDATLKKIRLIMDDPPEVVFEASEDDVDINELNKKDILTAKTAKLYMEYGRGALVPKRIPKDEDSGEEEKIKELIEKDSLNVPINDVEKAYKSRASKTMNFIGITVLRYIEFAFEGIDVDFDYINDDFFSVSLGIFYFLHDDIAAAMCSKDGTLKGPKCVSQKIDNMELTGFICLAIICPKVRPLLKMIFLKKGHKKFSLSCFEFLFYLYGDNVLYLLDYYPEYKKLMPLPPPMRRLLKDQIERQNVNVSGLDLTWLHSKILLDLVPKMEEGKIPRITTFGELLFELCAFSVSIKNYVAYGYILSQEISLRGELFQWIGKLLLTTNYKFIRNKNTFRESLAFIISPEGKEQRFDTYFNQTCASMIIKNEKESYSFITEFSKGLMIENSQKEAIDILYRFYFRYINQKLGRESLYTGDVY